MHCRLGWTHRIRCLWRQRRRYLLLSPLLLGIGRLLGAAAQVRHGDDACMCSVLRSAYSLRFLPRCCCCCCCREGTVESESSWLALGARGLTGGRARALVLSGESCVCDGSCGCVICGSICIGCACACSGIGCCCDGGSDACIPSVAWYIGCCCCCCGGCCMAVADGAYWGWP